MDNNLDKSQQQTDKSAPEDTTRESIDNARKALETRKNVTEKADDEFAEKEKKDAEQWRNEG